MVCERWSPRTKNVGKLEIYTLQSTKRKKRKTTGKSISCNFHDRCSPRLHTTNRCRHLHSEWAAKSKSSTSIFPIHIHADSAGWRNANRTRIAPCQEKNKNRKTRTKKNCSYVNLAPRVLRLSGWEQRQKQKKVLHLGRTPSAPFPPLTYSFLFTSYEYV